MRPLVVRGRRRGASPLLVVAALAVTAVVLLPLGYLLVRGSNGDAWAIAGRASTWQAVGRTILLAAAVTTATTLIAVPLAFLVARTDLPGRRVWAFVLALPLVIPSYVTALAMIGAFAPGGLVPEALGLRDSPSIHGFLGAFVTLTLATYPLTYLLALAGLRSADPALEEASRALGRGPWATFGRVTLPVLRPWIGSGALLVTLYVLADFGVVSLMRFTALTRAIFLQYRSAFDREPAAVLAILLVTVTVVALVLEARARGRTQQHRAGPTAAHRPAALGRWRWPALGFVGLVLLAALVLPVAVLVHWAIRALDVGMPEGVLSATLGSLGVSAAAAIVTVLAALPVAYLAARHRRPWTRVLERAAYLGGALPGVVIALSLVFFGTRLATPLYQTLVLLVAAYLVRFFPQAMAGAHAAIGRLSPRLEEAGRTLGRRPARVFATVTVPVIAPGLVAGAALVFLSTMKELPATLLLKPTGFETLATRLWSSTSVSAYGEAAIPALLLIAVSAPIVWLLVARPQTAERPGPTDRP
ncbi:ABC transporter permease [Patulibacter defluvii]|uniref:ABC transporter permease n=1 Tax=Patulibacter defluvii TaxID=3095358 RepID=UPI002A749296|nr:iron ABC transporter permease [Patulibacter sp. DM4]